MGSVIVVNGRELKSEFRQTEGGTLFLAGRLKRDMLSQPGTLTVEMMNPDGARSNQLTLEVVAEQ